MALLPAVVPQLIEKRSELVPARLARKVAALFGVPSDENPYRPLTWVCDFTTITVTEIARGAPLPTRAAAAWLRGQDHDGEWVEHDRAIVATNGRALPNEIVAATINRFGPDTKAAVVLTATNVLLAPVTAAMTTALSSLRSADGGELLPIQWIAAWAAAAVEVYRSQPALVVAAINARAIQRESLRAPMFPWADRLADGVKARCEIGASDPVPHDPVTRPRDLDFLDTIAASRLNATGQLPLPDPDAVPIAAGSSIGDRLVELLISLMVDMGTPDGVGYVWVSEREPGQAVVEAMVPSAGLVRELVETWAHGPGGLDRSDEFADELAVAIAHEVRLPAPSYVAELPVLARRVLVLAATGIVRQMGLLAPSAWIRGPEFAAMIDEIEALLDVFDAADLVVPEIRLRLAVQRAGIERQGGQVSADAITAVLAAADACLVSGALDRGALADVLSVACIELNMARTATEDTGALADALRRYWTAFADAVEVDLFAPDADLSGLNFQLHNLAAFLGGNRTSESDLRKALHLFEKSVIPGRARLFNRDRDIRPLARSLYLAADAAAALVEVLRQRGDRVEAGQWVERAFVWVSEVLADKLFAPGKLHPRLDDCLFALRATPVLLLAVEHDVAGDRHAVLDRADQLVRLVERWLKENVDDQVKRSRYHGTVTSLRARLTTLVAGS